MMCISFYLVCFAEIVQAHPVKMSMTLVDGVTLPEDYMKTLLPEKKVNVNLTLFVQEVEPLDMIQQSMSVRVQVNTHIKCYGDLFRYSSMRILRSMYLSLFPNDLFEI